MSAIQVNFDYTIDRPMAEVFNAIVDHNVISNYFTTSSDSDLIEGKTVRWKFEDIDQSTELTVTKVEKNKLIEFEWLTSDRPTLVKFRFNPIGLSATALKITEGQWDVENDGASKAIHQTIGWANFVCSLKAYLLFNVNLRTGEQLRPNLQANDKFFAKHQGLTNDALTRFEKQAPCGVAKDDQIQLIEAIRREEGALLRKEIARDFHDEMGNQLARLINYVSWIRINETNASEAISGVEESAKNLMNGTRDFIWALDSSNDCISNLFIHIKEFGEKLFSEKGIDFKSFNDVRMNRPLPSGYGRQINLIFKEAMTNAFKHSKASSVEFSVFQRDGELVCSLCDNGVGVCRDKITLANGGLANMQVRAKRIHSELVIASFEGKHTEIVLVVPIKII